MKKPEVASTVKELDEMLRSARRSDKVIGLVPTMGNLHEGHLSLVSKAAELCDVVVVSLFINPVQFNNPEDFERYPRTEEADLKALSHSDCDIVFMPSASEIYPQDNNIITSVSVGALSEILCGKYRPGHFAGVGLVISKLFNIVQPDIAVFGEKDFQQLQIVKTLVRDLNFKVRIVGSPTVRDSDGLAMSSRNSGLSSEERSKASMLYSSLTKAADLFRKKTNMDEIRNRIFSELEDSGFRPEYLECRSGHNLSELASNENDAVMLIAAYLGKARLIDNLQFKIIP